MQLFPRRLALCTAPPTPKRVGCRPLLCRPVIEYCGGTEIGGGFLTATRLQPQVPAAFSTVAIGARLVLLGRSGQQSPPAAAGLPFTG
jgi:hypothetical protein